MLLSYKANYILNFQRLVCYLLRNKKTDTGQFFNSLNISARLAVYF